MKRNIILVGMPGSDKTIIGRILSDRLGLKFINTDQHKKDNISKTELDICKNKSSVISTELDMIKNPSDIKKLQENGVVIFIDKSVEKIIEDQETLNNRNLLKDEVLKLHKHFQDKYELYRKCCNLHLVNNNNNIEEIVYYISTIWS